MTDFCNVPVHPLNCLYYLHQDLICVESSKIRCKRYEFFICNLRPHFAFPLRICAVFANFLTTVLLSLCVTGQVSRSSLKQPRSCNIFKALFCCLQAQDGPKPPPTPPPSLQPLLESQENGTVVKVTLFLLRQYITPLKAI